MARATTITPKLQATEKKVCEERKLIAQGILELCLNVNSGKMILGAMDNSATCATNFNTALANADTLAASYGTACRYVDNGDGTVSDLNTGLMWEQTTGTVGGTNTGDVNDVNNGPYAWSNTPHSPRRGGVHGGSGGAEQRRVDRRWGRLSPIPCSRQDDHNESADEASHFPDEPPLPPYSGAGTGPYLCATMIIRRVPIAYASPSNPPNTAVTCSPTRSRMRVISVSV